MKRLFINFFLFILVTGTAQVSQKEKDSILGILSQQKSLDKMHSLDQLFDYYYRNNLDSAAYYNNLLRKEAETNENQRYLACYYNNAGIYDVVSNHKLQSAVENMQKAIALSKDFPNQKNELADYYKNLAGIYYELGDNKAIDYTYKAYRIYEENSNIKGALISLNHLGMLFKKNKDYKKALSYQLKALALAEQHKILKKIPIIQHNLGIDYAYLKQADSSLYFYKKALQNFKKNKSESDIAAIYADMGNLYTNVLQQIDSANYYYQKALKYNQFEDIVSEVNTSLAKMYAGQKNYQKSNHYLLNSLKLSQKTHSWEDLQYVHYYLYQNYKNLNRWDSATYHLENFIDYQDSINMQESKVKIENLEAKYKNEKNKLKIEKLELQKQKDRKIRWLLIGSLLLSLLVFAFVIRTYVLRRRKNQLARQLLETEKENIAQDLQHKTKELTTQALMILEKNKLLEEILQNLSVIKSTGTETHKELLGLKRKLKRSMQSDKDWDLFKQYFEQVNKNFFKSLKAINSKISPAEMKLAALIKLGFSIKESASLLSISEGSVKTGRYELRKKLGLKREDNLYVYLNNI
jgi:DNA-binding CsgD family transcriptional regulator